MGVRNPKACSPGRSTLGRAHAIHKINAYITPAAPIAAHSGLGHGVSYSWRTMGCVRNSLAACTLMLVLAAATAGTLEQGNAQPKTYLLPVLRFGPSNQRRDLRYLMALAKELGCGIIPQGIYKHYLDRAERPVLDELKDSAEQRRQQGIAPVQNGLSSPASAADQGSSADQATTEGPSSKADQLTASAQSGTAQEPTTIARSAAAEQPATRRAGRLRRRELEVPHRRAARALLVPQQRSQPAAVAEAHARAPGQRGQPRQLQGQQPRQLQLQEAAFVGDIDSDHTEVQAWYQQRHLLWVAQPQPQDGSRPGSTDTTGSTGTPGSTASERAMGGASHCNAGGRDRALQGYVVPAGGRVQWGVKAARSTRQEYSEALSSVLSSLQEGQQIKASRSRSSSNAGSRSQGADAAAPQPSSDAASQGGPGSSSAGSTSSGQQTGTGGSKAATGEDTPQLEAGSSQRGQQAQLSEGPPSKDQKEEEQGQESHGGGSGGDHEGPGPAPADGEAHADGAANAAGDAAASAEAPAAGEPPADGELAGTSTAPHLPPCLRNRVAHYMEFDELFDRQHVSEWLPTASVEELREQGWDGSVDLIIQSATDGEEPPASHTKFVHMAFKAAGLQLSPNVTWRYARENISCDGGLLDDLRQAVAPFRVVAVMSVFLSDWSSVDISKETNTLPDGASTCEQHVFEANRLLRPSPWLASLADRYISQSFGRERFVAVHVRPYPDECLLEWIRPGPLNETAITQNCYWRHHGMHRRLVTCTLAMLKAYAAQHVYVMAHPAIRARVSELFQQGGGITPHYLEHTTFNDLTECHDTSTTFLAMVEDAIATQAYAFLGTTKSSITEAIVLERWSYGLERNTYLDSRGSTCLPDGWNTSSPTSSTSLASGNNTSTSDTSVSAAGTTSSQSSNNPADTDASAATGTTSADTGSKATGEADTATADSADSATADTAGSAAAADTGPVNAAGADPNADSHSGAQSTADADSTTAAGADPSTTAAAGGIRPLNTADADAGQGAALALPGASGVSTGSEGMEQQPADLTDIGLTGWANSPLGISTSLTMAPEDGA